MKALAQAVLAMFGHTIGQAQPPTGRARQAMRSYFLQAFASG